jgi:hypothetical protein
MDTPPQPTYSVTCAACPGTTSGLYKDTVTSWVREHAATAHPFWDLAVVQRNVHVACDTPTTRSAETLAVGRV